MAEKGFLSAEARVVIELGGAEGSCANEENNIALRSLQVLDAFALIQSPARVMDIQRLMKAPQSSISKLLKAMSKRGYLDYDPHTRSYFPTLRVAMLGNWLRDDGPQNRALIEIAEDLHQRFAASGVGGFRTTVVLGVQNDTQVMYVAELPVIDRPRPPLVVGMLRPICVAGAGKALMMMKSDQQASLLIRRINTETDDPARHIDSRGFLKEMAESRARGYALSFGGVNTDTGGIAVPLPPMPHQPRMALGLAVSLDVMQDNLELMAETLLQKRDALTRAAQATPNPGPAPAF